MIDVLRVSQCSRMSDHLRLDLLEPRPNQRNAARFADLTIFQTCLIKQCFVVLFKMVCRNCRITNCDERTRVKVHRVIRDDNTITIYAGLQAG